MPLAQSVSRYHLSRAALTAALFLAAGAVVLPVRAMSAQPAPARKEIGRTTIGTPTAVYVEPRTISRTGDIVTAAIRVQLVPPMKHSSGELKSSRTMGMYNCSARTVATKESWYYLDEAGRKEGMHREVRIPGFGPVGKGSVADIALTWLCANTTASAPPR
jgi:hypothetical protein